MQLEDVTTFLILEGLFVALVMFLVVFTTLRANKNLQNTVLFQVKALMRYVQYMRSDTYREGVEEKVRAELSKETPPPPPAPAPVPAPIALVAEPPPLPPPLVLEINQSVLDEMKALEAASAEYAQNGPLIDESEDLARMRELITRQEAELAALREKVRGESLSANMTAMMNVQQQLVKQYQESERNLRLAVQMQEQQIHEAKERFSRAMVRLREESTANNSLRAQIQRLEVQLRQTRKVMY